MTSYSRRVMMMSLQMMMKIQRATHLLDQHQQKAHNQEEHCRNNITVIFCHVANTLACALAINHPTIDSADADGLVYFVFKKHHTELLEFSELPSARAFLTHSRLLLASRLKPMNTRPCPWKVSLSVFVSPVFLPPQPSLP
jgi:hypothetical protein